MDWIAAFHRDAGRRQKSSAFTHCRPRRGAALRLLLPGKRTWKKRSSISSATSGKEDAAAIVEAERKEAF
jgi:hypothetical protein